MVLGSVGLVVAAGNLAAKRVADGSLTLPTMNTKDARDDMVVRASGSRGSRSRPLRKIEGADSVDVAGGGSETSETSDRRADETSRG
jgi:hypothetical protein